MAIAIWLEHGGVYAAANLRGGVLNCEAGTGPACQKAECFR
jgi:prolyl oligopeptidase PreP (S9A serine peptidase family)